MTFEFATANRVLFGPGRVKELPDHARQHSRSCLFVTGANTDRSEASRRLLIARGVGVTHFSIIGEPTIEVVKDGAAQTRYHTCDLVIGFGGGSVIDAAKAIAALATNRRPALDYLEIIGKGEPLETKPLPTIMVPTTAGTGSEVTRNAVLTSPEHKTKVSLRHFSMLPTLALLDPTLTQTMPPAVTAATGLDALAQLIEPFVSTRANPITDACCRQGITLVGQSLRKAFHEGANEEARSNMMIASLLGGMALANSGLGAVHGFAAPLGAMYNAPHGSLCAALLPSVLRVNIRRAAQKPETAARYEEIARLLTGNPAAPLKDCIARVETFCSDFNIPPLSHFISNRADFPLIIEKAKATSSMRANPFELTDPELTEILTTAF